MTRSTAADAVWAIEIEREDGPAEYFSVLALKATGDELQILTPAKEHVTFKAAKIRKILVMRATQEEVATT